MYSSLINVIPVSVSTMVCIIVMIIISGILKHLMSLDKCLRTYYVGRMGLKERILR